MTLSYSLRLWFYSFNICNRNDDFISINETRKQCSLFFNDQEDHGNTWANLFEFNDECFTQVYRSMYKFLFYTNFDIYLYAFCSK